MHGSVVSLKLLHTGEIIHILDLEILEMLDDLDGVVGEMFDNLPLARRVITRRDTIPPRIQYGSKAVKGKGKECSTKWP